MWESIVIGGSFWNRITEYPYSIWKISYTCIDYSKSIMYTLKYGCSVLYNRTWKLIDGWNVDLHMMQLYIIYFIVFLFEKDFDWAWNNIGCINIIVNGNIYTCYRWFVVKWRIFWTPDEARRRIHFQIWEISGDEQQYSVKTKLVFCQVLCVGGVVWSYK